AHARDHVVHQLAHGARHGIGLARLVGRRELEHASVVFDLDQCVFGQAQSAQRTLDADQTVLDGHFDPGGGGNRLLTNTGHFGFASRPAAADVAQHFAPAAVGTGLAVGHPALGGGDDGHAQAVHDLGQGVAAAVDAQAGLAHALDALDHGTAGVVLQGDFE